MLTHYSSASSLQDLPVTQVNERVFIAKCRADLKEEAMSIQWLFDIIQSRKEAPSEGSYTSSLFAEGLPKIAQKVGEEGTEVVVAALAQDDQRLVEEVADLTYHTLVLLAARGVGIQDVLAELERRHKS